MVSNKRSYEERPSSLVEETFYLSHGQLVATNRSVCDQMILEGAWTVEDCVGMTQFDDPEVANPESEFSSASGYSIIGAREGIIAGLLSFDTKEVEGETFIVAPGRRYNVLIPIKKHDTLAGIVEDPIKGRRIRISNKKNLSKFF